MAYRFALQRPTVLMVIMAIVCLFGLASLMRVPIQLIPDLDPRIVTVQTVWPGANPQDVEREILIEQEEFLRNVPGLERMISTSSFGQGSIELEFPFGMDINEALIRTSNALSQVPRYPENVDEPRISTESMSQNAFAFYSIMPLPGNPQGVRIREETDWLEDNVQSRIERVPGVASAIVGGGTRRQVNIYLDPARLAAHQLSVPEVRQAIRARNRDVSGGDMDFGKRRYLVRSLGRFETVQDVNDLIVAERNGAFIRLSDVGHAEMGQSEWRAARYIRGEQAMFMAVRKQVGANIIEVFDGIEAAVAELNEGPAKQRGIEIVANQDDVRYIRASVRTVVTNLLLGAVLATLVLRLFLQSWSATLIGAVGIPICVLAGFLGLSLTGRTINVFSLAGIAFAIGMTLDNSIVVLENITRYRGKGLSRAEAALRGVAEVWPAVLASTLTTVMVFLPVVLLELEAGQLYSDIAVAISTMILMSMLVAITVVPALSSRFLHYDGAAAESGAGVGGAVRRLGLRILALTEWLLATAHRRVAALILTLVGTLGILVFLTPPAEYLPEGEEAKIFARLFAPPGYNMQTMLDIWAGLDPQFVAQIGADGSDFASGKTPIPPLLQHISFVSPGSMFNVTEPIDPGHTDDLIEATTELFRSVPGMRSFASRGSIFSDNQGGSRSINVELSGRNLEQLFATALNTLNEAEALFEGGQVNSDPSPTGLGMSQPIARVVPDWERAAELGVTQDQLGYTLWAYSDGAFVDEFYLDDDKLDMYLYSTQGAIAKPADLQSVMLHTRDGAVQLSSLARVEEVVGVNSIRRVNGMRTVTLGIIPPRSVALESGVEIVKRDLIGSLRERGEIPPEISTTITGASTALEETRAEMGGNFLLAILIAYLLMVAVLSHWGYPLVIMTTVPIGISGGLIGLWLLNAVGGNLDWLGLDTFTQPFDVITMLGFLILIGTVVNNPILIVERASREIEEQGMGIREAVREATRTRLRPVMMSTITTVFGLSPLVLLPGAGAELYRGLGAIVLFGLLFSSFITLTVLPVLLTAFFKLAQRFSRAA
ncbi:MAG: efflux RND transporter permease subunit [Woeseiaceae bacterium]